MSDILKYALFGAGAGVLGTGLGGALAFVTQNRGQRFLSSVLEFAAGLMLAIVLVDLLPHSLEFASLGLVLSGFAIGIWFMFLAEGFVERRQEKISRMSKQKRDFFRMGMAMVLGVALHNFPEGLAVGAGFDASFSLGLSLCITIALHNIPEGIAMTVPLRASGMATWKAVVIAALSGLPMGLGALLGAAAGAVSPVMVSFCLSLAAGTMLYIVLSDLIPASKKMYGGRLPSFFNIVGVLAGILLSVGLD